MFRKNLCRGSYQVMVGYDGNEEKEGNEDEIKLYYKRNKLLN